MIRAVMAAVVCLCGCSRSSEITSCQDSLRGVWRAEGGAWMLLDNGDSLEMYPLFDDAPPGEPIAAPRVIELVRKPDGIRGDLRRRYMQAATSCTAKVPVRITACSTSSLDIVLADPSPPISFEPCTWPRANSSRRETWLRE